ncbi:MAG TPA: ribulose-phosphate 3-epimerase [Nitrospinota bacterium]|nr:ribulose-phosphate 3-epimerase [Nitrospinota bacterium]
MVKVAPSILSADFSKLDTEIKDVEKAGADLIHFDVMDGHFVPNITIGPLILKAVRKSTQLPLDVHLMVENPDNFIKAFADAGADIITVHVEACTDLQRTVELIRSCKVSPGIVLNPSTPLSALDDILDDVDMVLLMSVNPGFEGQSFIPSVLQKVTQLKKIIQNKNNPIDIEVDGGVKPNNAKEIREAGVDILVAGSAVFYSSDYKKSIDAIREGENSIVEV